MSSFKHQRLEKRIIRLLSELYFKELKSSTVGFITFVRCELSKDYSIAKVYVSLLDDIKGVGIENPSLKNLKKLKYFFSKRIGKALNIHCFPDIQFILDTSLKMTYIQPPNNNTETF